MTRATRRVEVEHLHDLLAEAPRANIAFRNGDAVEAAPVAFRFDGSHYWIGVPRMAAIRAGETVTLLIDDGRWFFDLRGLWMSGRVTPRDRLPDGLAPSLHWFELVPERTAAWDYGTLRAVPNDAA